MNRIKHKLCSRSGASISFALLLFLVCAVLCSVILAAATAAAGRMAKIAETDQRYYAVTSAAELMKDIINNKTVTVVKVTTSTKTTTYTNGVAGTPFQNEGSSSSVYLVPDKTGNEVTSADCVDGNIINDSTVFSTIPADAAYKYYSDITPTSTNPRFTLESSDELKSALGVGNSDPLAVSIKEELDENGNITLTLYNTSGSPFTQKMVFTATVSTGSSTTTSDGAPSPPTVSGSNTTYTVETTTTETNTTTLIWTLTSVEIISQPVSASTSGS